MNELDELVKVSPGDVLACKKSETELYGHLRTVVQRMLDARLSGKLACELVVHRGQYLVCEPGQVGPNPDKVAKIKNRPREPKGRKQLRGFVGLVGYYRRLIPNTNKRAHPLYDFLCDDSDMVWSARHPQAVQQLP